MLSNIMNNRDCHFGRNCAALVYLLAIIARFDLWYQCDAPLLLLNRASSLWALVEDTG